MLTRLTKRGISTMLEQYEEILSVEELCEVLRLGSNAAYSLVNSGAVKAFRNGRTWRIPKCAVVDYIYSKIN